MSQKTIKVGQRLRVEGSQPILYKVVRLSIPTHKQMITIEASLEKALQKKMTHSDTIDELMENWVSSET